MSKYEVITIVISIIKLIIGLVKLYFAHKKSRPDVRQRKNG